jgi:microcin C transport system permease protein
MAFIAKRLLLMIPTLFGVLLLTFAMVQFVPSGPVEQMVAQLQGRDSRWQVLPQQARIPGQASVDANGLKRIKVLYEARQTDA